MTGTAESLSTRRLAHRRAAEEAGQKVWIAFGGVADQPWLHPLRPGFRHCFAALGDEAGWTVLEPLSGRLLVARLPVEGSFDLPGFYRRAGLRVLGPFTPGAPRPQRLPSLAPFTCVALCQALLGHDGPRAWTPFQLFRALGGVEKENIQDK
ncbi:hypothetical protein [Falsiroseomonas sp.]|uniref:hypothetical protein n=1 Tax=Falsiroseomonas sp. TaxID=2870721 RepID=UPI002735551D|nr:hypothetical protein [Falsiroseomonas sp.]MDP3414549.1 hypothetical protein [Falsiroseomonas sp.]